jgi:hypothetical protein
MDGRAGERAYLFQQTIRVIANVANKLGSYADCKSSDSYVVLFALDSLLLSYV